MAWPAIHTAFVVLALAALGSAATAATASVAMAEKSNRPIQAGPAGSADVSVTIDNGIDEIETGQTVIYQIEVASAGPSDTEAAIGVGFPPGLLACSWSCAASNGADCPAPGSGDIDESLSLPALASATFTATCAVPTSIPIPPPQFLTVAAQVTTLANDPDPDNNSAFDTDALIPVVDVAVNIDDNVNIVWYGHELVYRIGVFSTGADAIVRVLNPVPSNLTNCAWTCQSFIGNFCPTPSSGTGNIDAELVLPAWSGGQPEFVRFTSTCLVSQNAVLDVVNTALLVLAPPFRDLDASNNQASDTDTLIRSVDLSASVSDGLQYVQVGDFLDYVIRIDNAGPENGKLTQVSDTLPAGVSSGVWDCTPSAGATCNPGSGDTLIDVASIPAGGHVIYLFSGIVQPHDFSAPIANQVAAFSDLETFDPTPDNNVATDSPADIVVLFRADFD